MAGLQIRLSSAYRSIEKLDASSLPDFAILIGRNDVGKTQLLKALVEGIATASEIPRNEVEPSIRHRIERKVLREQIFTERDSKIEKIRQQAT